MRNTGSQIGNKKRIEQNALFSYKTPYYMAALHILFKKFSQHLRLTGFNLPFALDWFTGKRLLIWLAFLVLVTQAKAQQSPELPREARLSGWLNPAEELEDWETNAQLVNEAEATVAVPMGIWSVARARNVITVSIFEESPFYIPNDFAATLSLEIKYKTGAGALQTLNKDLTVDFKKAAGAKFNAKQAISFEGATYVQVKVIDVDITGIDSADGIKFINLQNQLFYTWDYVLSPSTAPTTFSHENAIDDELLVTILWPESAGNNGSQLEWAWVDDEMDDIYKSGGVIVPAKVFENNATRVDLQLQQRKYSIPLYYDGIGKLYYRVRSVLVTPAGTQEGEWVYCSSPFSYNGHESKLNWQVTTSFAEEGKRKSVVQYYDGSLRNRQTATKDNTTNRVVYAETLYDEQGRPAVQILPTPTIQNAISYAKNLNRFNGQAENMDPLDYFDLKIGPPSSFLGTLDSSSGAAKYYSRNNDELAPGNEVNFLPAADGYPYTLTRYTPDATGRVAMQSGVGKTFRMDGGRETKYYYGTPSQEELDGLFGTDVGYFTHYAKNMVQDANGQMSVSYVDMHGRTIATALAGDSPSNMVPLDRDNQDVYINQGADSLTNDLLNGGTNTVKGNIIESVTGLLVPNKTYYTFKYKLDTASVKLPTCTSGQRCYDLLFDLEFSVVRELPDEGEPVVFKYSNVSANPDDSCASPVPYFKSVPGGVVQTGNNISFTLSLDPGSYLVRKTLKLSESSLEHYKAMYLQKALCKTEQEIIDSIYNVLIEVTGCDTVVTQSDCQACLTSVGDSTTFRSNYLSGIDWVAVTDSLALETEIRQAYQEALNRCNNLCLKASPYLRIKRDQMLQDMMPFTGQYAVGTVPADPGMPTTLYNKYNIFSTASPGTQPFYRKPKKADGSALGYYANWQGSIDLTIHPTGTTAPYDFLNTLDKNQFTALFQRNWAYSLLPYHPEFPKLRFAEEKLQQSYDWIYRFSSIDTWQEASDSGFIFTTKASITDPFYLQAPGAMKDTMAKWIATSYIQGLSLWKLAYADVKCKDIIGLAEREACYTYAPSVPPFSSLTTDEKDRAWRSFQGLYNMAREGQVNRLLADSVILTDSINLPENGYKLRFPNSRNIEMDQNGWSGYPSSPYTAPDTTGLEGAGDPAGSRCESYITNWRRWLLECDSIANHPDSSAILNEILAGMVAVCKKGQDAANPYGSSNVAPGTPVDGSPRSFEEVIYAVFEAHGINRNTFCNAYQIEFPKPYGKSRPLVKGYTSTLDSCNCDRVDSLKAQAITAGYNPSTMSGFNSFLWATYHDTLSSTLYNAFSKCDSLGGYDIKCRTITDTIFYHCDSTPPVCENSQSLLRAAPGDCPPGYFWSEIKQRCMPELVIDPEDSCYITCPVSVCDTVWRTQIVLSTPVILPDFLKCGYVATNQCFSCAELSLLTQAFKDTFSTVTNAGPYFPYNTGPVFNNYVLTDEQVEHNRLYARFLNYRTGLQLSWADYARLADSANCDLGAYMGNIGGGVANLTVSSRSGNTPPEYTATSTVELLPGFESGVNDQFIAYISDGEPANQTVVCIDATAVTDTTGVVVTDPPCQRVMNMSIVQGQEIYRIRKEYLLGQFEQAYRDAFAAAGEMESFTVGHKKSEYHYTLYYYDQAGNLVKTVPPKGVNPRYAKSWTDSVRQARLDDKRLQRPHSLVTEYRYNSLNQVVQQKSPDGGTSAFWYDKLGRLVVSQNAKQKPDDKYSYTRYDVLGRITEVGEKVQANDMTAVISRDPEDLEDWITATTGGGESRKQVTLTVYDTPYGGGMYPEGVLGGDDGYYMTQRNLRNRVSYSWIKRDAADVSKVAGTFYTYDIHGNVDTLVQDYEGIAVMATDDRDRYKRITYNYDLISGKVNGVNYQPGEIDAFYHRYYYDAENRLTSVKTSRDSVIWEEDAAYEYYRHGPLLRTKLGQLNVQGLDYAYTLQGWLKGINGTAVGDGSNDMGQDGLLDRMTVARDVFGLGLHYYDTIGHSDYRAIGDGVAPFAKPNNTDFRSLYNGNIAGMSVNLAALSRAAEGVNAAPLFYKYRYDQLNRLVSMRAYKGFNNSTNAWTPVLLDDYREDVRYDANGNILNYIRNGSPEVPDSAKLMDSLTYKYWANTNQLKQVLDDAGYSENYWADIDNQTETENYVYDAIGNLVQDKSENLTIAWNVYGKIDSIVKPGGTIKYTYDAAGNRISKSYDGKTTVYVRDAGGNVMSIYQKDGAGALDQQELHLYGSSRLGLTGKRTADPEAVTLATGFDPGKLITFTRGEKIFELSNHLGNVLATINDKKLATDDGNGEVAYYEADVVTANDYYPFGMIMPGRKYSSSSLYRYGFNGQERSTEIDPNGNSMTAEFWQYEARLGRRWNVDPVFKEFESPYASFGNNPVWLRDPNGADTIPTNSTNAVELRKQLRSKNVSAWSDLLNNKVSKDLIGGANKSRDLEAAKIQSIEKASNDPTNVDMYSITIDKLPNGVNSASELLEFIRKNFASLMPGDVDFSGFDSDQRKIWDSKDPTGAVMSFDKNFALWGVIGDDASVLTSKYYTDDKLAYWNFTTLNTVWGDFGHPVSGTRQFGVTESKFRSASRYTFFIRGIDRVADNLTKLGGLLSSEYVFKQAHDTWITVMDKTSTLINKNGGQVTWSTYVSQRVSWRTDVKPLFQPSAPAAK